jgi:hypothetical protein
MLCLTGTVSVPGPLADAATVPLLLDDYAVVVTEAPSERTLSESEKTVSLSDA